MSRKLAQLVNEVTLDIAASYFLCWDHYDTAYDPTQLEDLELPKVRRVFVEKQVASIKLADEDDQRAMQMYVVEALERMRC